MQAQELLVDKDVNVDQVQDLFKQVFSKTLDKVLLTDIFSAEWDSYREVSN